jgi:cell division GTPase FtsZ
MSKLGALIGWGEGGGNVTGDMLGNLLEGIDIKFSFTQHHLLGGMLRRGQELVQRECWRRLDARGWTELVRLPLICAR